MDDRRWAVLREVGSLLARSWRSWSGKMAETHLDHPGEISWWVGHTPAPVIGPCPHRDCEHRDARPIAYGPDYDHYELHECAGCRCRGWYGEHPRQGAGPIRVWPEQWLQVAIPAAL